jgi:hypothetical protein
MVLPSGTNSLSTIPLKWNLITFPMHCVYIQKILYICMHACSRQNFQFIVVRFKLNYPLPTFSL